MNPLLIIALSALGVVGVGGFASLPSDADLTPATAIVDPYAELPLLEPYQTRPEAPETTETARRGICPPVYDTALLVGFTPDQSALLDRIAWHESRCLTDARGDLTKGVSHGILQIHGPSWCEPSRYWPDGYLQTKGILDTCEDLYDPEISVLAARLIWMEGGFEQWSTYEMALIP
jgi:hypothetical protein